MEEIVALLLKELGKETAISVIKEIVKKAFESLSSEKEKKKSR